MDIYTCLAATRKQTASMGTGGGPVPEELTPAEILALGINNGPKIVGIEVGSSSNPLAPEIRAPYVEVTGDQIILLDPPQVHIEDAAGTQVDPGEGPSQQPHDDDDDYDDDETLTGRDTELQDEPRPSPAGKRTTSAGQSERSLTALPSMSSGMGLGPSHLSSSVTSRSLSLRMVAILWRMAQATMISQARSGETLRYASVWVNGLVLSWKTLGAGGGRKALPHAA
ncbi:uncharacterized protein LOC120562396 isoform X3 [Perca fluviatilis]|uniref:uncharacterized protein LOC120562396 isoform X3 n=1 Tax=Perca fluviatilis TaxID=8168 RepID=UPI0019660747|nr:uncharacterized protein LOC120562396 isoform X3 [Perca fluviatilis]